MEQQVATSTRLLMAGFTGLLLMAWLMVSAAPPAHAFGSSEPPPLPSVNAGGYMTCGILDDGTATCWGDNVNEGPGQATPPAGVTFREVNAGYAVGCGVTTEGTIRCWGNNLFGKVTTLVPAGNDFFHVAPGFHMICALRNDGSLPDGQGRPVCWGSDTVNDAVVTAAPTAEVFTQLTMGIRHACGLRPDGTILCWGHDTGTEGQTVVPPGTYRYVTSGNFTNCAIRDTDDALDGTVICWGRNNGLQVTTVPVGTFTMVNAGFGHVCGLRPDGTILCWGRASEGQLDAPAGTYNNVSAGTFHSCAMPTSGPPAACWGNNAAGRVQPNLSDAAPPAGQVGEPYSFPLAMTTHLSPAPTFSVTDGALPPGVTLSPTGELAGTPTEAGTYTITVAATNGLSPPDCVSTTTGSLPCTPGDPNSTATATRVFTITVNPADVGDPGSITGQVTAAGGGPVGDATVTATDSEGAEAGQATTDANGDYTIGDLPAGEYTVTADADGYESATQTGVEVLSGEATTVDFALEESGPCGQVITEDTTLDEDIGPCSDNGVIVGADDITLDLNGHRIFGTPETGDGAGVLLDEVSGVTVRNGTVSDFDGGVAILGGSNNTVTDLTARDNIGRARTASVPGTLYGDGIAILSSTDNTVLDNVVENNGPFAGIGLYSEIDLDHPRDVAGPSTRNTIDGNTVRDNDACRSPTGTCDNDGIRLEPGTRANSIVNNTITGSALDGIAVFSRVSTDNQIIGNRVEGNGFHPRTHRKGDGIRVFGFNATLQLPGGDRTLIQDNEILGNAANGIRMDAQNSTIIDNRVVGNNAVPHATLVQADLHDSNFDPPCDANVWSGNIYGTFNQPCVTAGGTQVPAIVGQVTDATSGAPIAGATVTANGQSATTDGDGEYAFQALEPGQYTVTVDADGYESATQTATVTAGEVTELDFALQEPPPPPANPTTRQDCMKGGWQQYGFRNQGQCIQYVNTGKDNRA